MSSPNFRSRPLRGTDRDNALFVRPPDIIERLLRSVELGFNSIVIAEPGMGASSLLGFAGSQLEESDRKVVFISALGDPDVGHLLERLATRLDRSKEGDLKGVTRQAALSHLRVAAQGAPGSVIVLDDVRGNVGHDLFGRMRDELWELDLQWLVATSTAEAAAVLTPPADAFFETIVHLQPLPRAQVVELLDRRDPSDELSSANRERIADLSGGHPARAMALARKAMLVESSERAAALTEDPISQAEEQLGGNAALLLSELLTAGPAGPSDPELLERLGLSKTRAYQLFQELERRGLVRSHNRKTGKQGRPKKIYEAVGS